MLVTSRKPGQRLLIGENVVITIVKVRGSTVRVGVDAPASVRVMREELVQREGDRDARRRAG